MTTVSTRSGEKFLTLFYDEKARPLHRGAVGGGLQYWRSVDQAMAILASGGSEATALQLLLRRPRLRSATTRLPKW